MINVDENISTIPETVDTFSNVLNSMTPDVLSTFVGILSSGRDYDKHALISLYPPTSEHFESYQDFLRSHDISFAAGVNSKNFLLSSNQDGSLYILKLENRLNAPKEIDVYLRDRMHDVFTPIYVSRDTSYIDADGKTNNRTVILTTLCDKGSLADESRVQKSIDLTIDSSLNYYTQMAQILKLIKDNGCFFPDMKNGNWLIDENDILQIADTKSFVYTTLDGVYDAALQANTGYSLLKTEIFSPVEFYLGKPFAVDNAHAYIMGCNLYQYLTGCNDSYLANIDYSFDKEIFKTSEGRKLKTLIAGSLKRDPVVSVDYILNKLQEIKTEKAMRDECMLRLKSISLYTLSEEDDLILNNFIIDSINILKQDASIEELNSIKSNLDSMEELLKESLAVREIYDSIDIFLEKKPPTSTLIISEMQALKQVLLHTSLEQRNGDNAKIIEVKSKIHSLKTSASYFETCKRLLQQIETYKVSTNDTQMNAFLIEKSNEISSCSSPEDMFVIQHKLEDTLHRLQESSPLVNNIKKVANEFITDTSMFKTGKKQKGLLIESSLCAVPLDKRGSILTDDSIEAKSLRTAITARRGFIRNSVSEDSSIDELKQWLNPEVVGDATQKFNKFKKDLKLIKQPDDTAIDTIDSDNTLGGRNANKR